MSSAAEAYAYTNPFEDYERFLVFSNPVSRHAAGIETERFQFLGQAGARHMGWTVVDTAKEQDEMTETVDKHARPGDLIVVRGGDGAISNALTGIVELGLDNATMLHPKGHINDIAHQLYDKEFYDNLEAIFANNILEDYHPLEAKLNGITEIAWAYLTFGASGLGAFLYNHPEYKNNAVHNIPGGTYVAERVMAVIAYFGNRSFTVQEGHGKPRKQHERIYANGDSMAGQLKLGADLFSAEKRVMDARNKTMGFYLLGSLLAGHKIGHAFTEEQHITVEGRPHFWESKDSPKRVWKQKDGEEELLEGPIEATIKRSEKSVRVFTARKATLRQAA